jgi:hypothetical protein
MQKDDVKLLYEWANTHGKCVRQRTVRQETTSYKCGTLPLNMYVSTSIEGTEVTFNHIDEYDDSESENETEETSSSQLSHVLVGRWSWITRGIKLFNHSQFFSIRQNTTRFFTIVGLHMISVFLSSDLNCCIISHNGFCFPILSSSTTMYHSRSPKFVLK